MDKEHKQFTKKGQSANKQIENNPFYTANENKMLFLPSKLVRF